MGFLQCVNFIDFPMEDYPSVLAIRMSPIEETCGLVAMELHIHLCCNLFLFNCEH